MFKTIYLVFVGLVAFMGLHLFYQVWQPAGEEWLATFWVTVVLWMLSKRGNAPFMMMMGITSFITGVALVIYLYSLAYFPVDIAWVLFAAVVCATISSYAPAWAAFARVSKVQKNPKSGSSDEGVFPG